MIPPTPFLGLEKPEVFGCYGLMTVSEQRYFTWGRGHRNFRMFDCVKQFERHTVTCERVETTYQSEPHPDP